MYLFSIKNPVIPRNDVSEVPKLLLQNSNAFAKKLLHELSLFQKC